mgnify:CR=1 FL=1
MPADGHEYITATFADQVYRAREAILIGENQWHAAWRSDEGVLPYVTDLHLEAEDGIDQRGIRRPAAVAHHRQRIFGGMA